MRRIPSGFTIIELLVVISIIGILATLSIVGFNRYQADARDAQRSSQATIISEALEKYYDQNGEYPSCSALTTTPDTVTSDTLVGLQKTVLVAPQAAGGTTNSIGCTQLSISGTDFFEYEGDGSGACSSGASCLAYKLKYKDEGDGTIQIIESRRNTDIDTSGNVALAGTGEQFSSINLTWNAIDNAADYVIQRANDAAFTTGLSSTTGTGTSGAITGLTPGNAYYVRIAPHASNGQGDWSNTIFVTVPHIATPVVSLLASTNPSNINVTWSAVSGATQYVIQRDTSSSFTSPQEVTQAGLSKAYNDASPATTYYIRVKATAPDDISSWSSTQSITPPVPQPTADPTVVAAMNGTNAEGTASASCTYGTLNYRLRYHSENTATLGSYSAYTAWSSTNVLSVAAMEGYRYVFQAQARCVVDGVSSPVVTSLETNVVRPIAQPPTPAWIGSTAWANGSTHTVNYTVNCPTGTSLVKGPSFSGGWQATGFNWSDGVNYFGVWPAGDQWTRPSGYGAGSPVRYYTNYRCSTTYANSPNSPTDTQDITIH